MPANINYKFVDPKLLELSLTHASYANEHASGHGNNQRLEFLGDAILDAVISEKIYNDYPELSEGDLSKMRSGLVCESALSAKAKAASLDSLIKMGRGELQTGGNLKDSILCDVYEALIGAIFLDGGFESAKSYIIAEFDDDISRIRQSFYKIDAKTYLQELIQGRSRENVSYNLLSAEGPDHDKVFRAEALHGGKRIGTGSGRTKKEAEQNAAQNALDNISKDASYLET